MDNKILELAHKPKTSWGEATLPASAVLGILGALVTKPRLKGALLGGTAGSILGTVNKLIKDKKINNARNILRNEYESNNLFIGS